MNTFYHMGFILAPEILVIKGFPVTSTSYHFTNTKTGLTTTFQLPKKDPTAHDVTKHGAVIFNKPVLLGLHHC